MKDQDRIQPYPKNPFYWQYKDQPVLLLGGSIEDNLFQIPKLEEHLDLLRSVGGNYMRCTMSSRDEGDVWPFDRDPATGLCDLSRPGNEYWQRFRCFLELAAERNIHRPADEHWQNPQEIRSRLIASGHVRPMNSVKIYGANSGRYGSTRDAQERFWRNVFGGLASSRFHRFPSGLGLNDIAQAHIRSMRAFTDEMDLFTCEPHNDLLQNRSWNEAYCTANPGVEYGLFFPDGGNVLLDVGAAQATPVTVRWMDIRRSEWTGDASSGTCEGEGTIHLLTPAEEGYWAALVQAQRHR